jgi:hypothetical protein
MGKSEVLNVVNNEDSCLLKCEAVLFGTCLPTFRGKLLLHLQGSLFFINGTSPFVIAIVYAKEKCNTKTRQRLY